MQFPQTFRHRRQIPGGYPTRTEENPCVIIRRFSAKKQVWHNQETNTPPRNYQVRHIVCIFVLVDAPLERTNPRVLRSNILNFTETTRGHKMLDPTMKYQKAIPENLVLHIYKRTNTNLNKSIFQMIVGAFFFGMWYCKYSTTPEGDHKLTHIL